MITATLPTFTRPNRPPPLIADAREQQLYTRMLEMCVSPTGAVIGGPDCLDAVAQWTARLQELDEERAALALMALYSYLTGPTAPTLPKDGRLLPVPVPWRVLPSPKPRDWVPPGPRPGRLPRSPRTPRPPRKPRARRPSRYTRRPRRARPPRPPRAPRPPRPVNRSKGPRGGHHDLVNYCVVPGGRFECLPIMKMCGWHRWNAAEQIALHPESTYIETEDCAACGGAGCGGDAGPLLIPCSWLPRAIEHAQKVAIVREHVERWNSRKQARRNRRFVRHAPTTATKYEGTIAAGQPSEGYVVIGPRPELVAKGHHVWPPPDCRRFPVGDARIEGIKAALGWVEVPLCV